MGVKLGLSHWGRTQAESVREQGAEGDSWVYEDNRRLQPAAWLAAPWCLRLRKHNLADKIKNDELGWACGMYGDEHTGV